MIHIAAEVLINITVFGHITFGVGFFFLVNALFYGQQCGYSAWTRFMLTWAGMLFNVTINWLTEQLIHKYESTNTKADGTNALLMAKTTLSRFFYSTLAVHLLFTSSDSQYAVMTGLTMTALLTTVRYDTNEIVVANIMSLVIGTVVTIIEHSHRTELENRLGYTFQQQQMNDYLQRCDKTTAFMSLFTGGMWFMQPISNMSSNIHIMDTKSWESMLITIAVSLVPLHIQIFRPTEAWIPFLFPETHVNMLHDNSESPVNHYYIVVTVAQNILLSVSCIVNTWFTLTEYTKHCVMQQTKKKLPIDAKCYMSLTTTLRPRGKTDRSNNHTETRRADTRDTEYFVITLLLVPLWASVLTYLDFGNMYLVYLVLALIPLLSYPCVALLYTIFRPRHYFKWR